MTGIFASLRLTPPVRMSLSSIKVQPVTCGAQPICSMTSGLRPPGEPNGDSYFFTSHAKVLSEHQDDLSLPKHFDKLVAVERPSIKTDYRALGNHMRNVTVIFLKENQGRTRDAVCFMHGKRSPRTSGAVITTLADHCARCLLLHFNSQ
jgi:hypothetical protein